MLADGTVWGWSGAGGIGDGSSDEPRYKPSQVITLSDAVAVVSSATASIALRTNGTACAWGGGSALGNGVSDGPSLVAAHVVGLGGVGALSLLDPTPDPFAFSPQTSVAAGALVVSNSVTVSGIDGTAPIALTAGEYSINGSPFVTTIGDAVVRAGDVIALRLPAPNSPGATSAATATIGGVSATFTVALSSAAFTDDPIVAGSTPIKAVHITELRARINALRQQFGLAAMAWTEPVINTGTAPKPVHFAEMRRALQEAHVAAGRGVLTFTADATLSPGVTGIRAAHIQELRNAVIALEGGVSI